MVNEEEDMAIKHKLIKDVVYLFAEPLTREFTPDDRNFKLMKLLKIDDKNIHFNERGLRNEKEK